MSEKVVPFSRLEHFQWKFIILLFCIFLHHFQDSALKFRGLTKTVGSSEETSNGTHSSLKKTTPISDFFANCNCKQPITFPKVEHLSCHGSRSVTNLDQPASLPQPGLPGKPRRLHICNESFKLNMKS